jgi:ribonuclease BN (tRNA processing enzyme)
MRLVLLGTGTPNAEPDRSGPSAALLIQERAILVDAGPGVVRMACRAFEAGIEQLRPNKLSHAFITHLHSDHTLGLPDLILTPWVLGRRDTLRLYGPPGLGAMVERILEAYEADVEERVRGLQPSEGEGPPVEVTELESGMTIELARVSVDAFAVNHGSMTAFGYRFRSPERTIAVSGDTAPFSGMNEVYAECDLLLHEVYSSVGLEDRSDEWKRYHRSVHTSATQLAAVAARAKPGMLVLYHQLLHGSDEASLMKEITSEYHGRISYGRDLDVY